jgi:diguanylate cyclase (GGDEF)-like protein
MDRPVDQSLTRVSGRTPTVLTVVLALVAAGFVTFLLAGNYRAAVARQETALRQHVLQTQDMAAAIEHFCAERGYEIAALADSRALAIYYENKALGMRPEYGLRASLVDVEAEYRRLIERRTPQGHPIYSRVVYTDHRLGPMVFAGDDAPASAEATGPIPSGFTWQAVGQSEVPGCAAAVSLSVPVIFKGKQVGYVTGIIPAAAMLERLQRQPHDPDQVRVFLADHRICCLPHGHGRSVERRCGPVIEAPPGQAVRFETPLRSGEPAVDVVASHSPVAGTGLDVVRVTPWRRALRGMTPTESLVLLVTITLGVLGGAGIMLRSIVRASAMAARLSEAARRHDELSQSNDKLIEEITQRCRAEAQLEHEATHDTLTGLANRRRFFTHLESAIKRAQSNPICTFAVLYLDFDRFKLINDSLGHHLGDRFLCECAARLGAWAEGQSDCGRSCMVSRLGGDEFAICLEAVTEPSGLPGIVEQLREQLSQPYLLENREVFATATVGLTLGDANTTDARQLLRDADIALYRAKARGRDCHVVYDRAMHEEVRLSLDLVSDMPRAIERGQLSLHYQPIVSLQETQVKGYEALLRWQHPVRGWVSPLRFIPLAEETGLIVEIGEWVLDQAARQLHAWRRDEAGAEQIYLSVNVSKRQLLQQEFSEQVATTLKQYDLPSEVLKLEVTESVVLEATEQFRPALDRLKAVGVDLMMDDFGTGNSSLSRLHEFPIDVLKIDRAFLRTMVSNRQLMSITAAVVQMAHNLDLQVVCEGVEDAEQVAILLELECDSAQGYYFGRPAPADEAVAYLRQRQFVGCLI